MNNPIMRVQINHHSPDNTWYCNALGWTFDVRLVFNTTFEQWSYIVGRVIYSYEMKR